MGRRRKDSEANLGVPPFSHDTALRVFIDPDLLQYDEVWAAAGTWQDVFGIDRGAAVVDLNRP